MWFSNLLFWSAQVTLLVLSGGLLVRALQLRHPRILLVLWRSLIALCLLLPFLQPWHSPVNISPTAISNDFPAAPLPPPSTPLTPHWHFPSTAQITGIVIFTGILVRLVFLALGLLKLRTLRRSSLPIPENSESAALLETMRTQLTARAEFRLSPDLDSPVTFGFASPVILLPERFPTLDPRFQSAIACHELLHVRRRDWAHHLAEEFVRAFLWFHPAIAWLISRVRLAREQVVDLEVVHQTQSRKPYIEALLEFTNRRPSIAAIPAPPFLAERQLVERVALMLKEVRMSRRKLIASLTVISCSLVLVVALAARSFPLKAAPRPVPTLQSSTDSGASGNRQSKSNYSSSDIPDVDISTVWIETVKKGLMVRQVRGLGKLVAQDGSSHLIARVTLPNSITADVKDGESASISTRGGLLVKGHVARVGSPSNETITIVDIAPDAALPKGITAGIEIDGIIDIETLDNVLHVGRPVNVAADATASVFKIFNDGKEAQRVEVKFGRASVNAIEVRDGLQADDKIILSDMSVFDGANRLRLSDRMHLEKH
jgi:beta-lactamase regulating signal transducer with metallopeptidase domain